MLGNKHIDLQYNIVQFNLVNPTNAAVNVDLFDTSVLTDVASQIPVGAYPDTLGRQITSFANSNCIAIDESRGYITYTDNTQLFTIQNIKTLETIVALNTAAYTNITSLIYVALTDKYYAVQNGYNILQINTLTGVIEATISLNPAVVLDDMLFNNQNNYIYTIDGTLNLIGYVSVYSFDTASLLTIALPNVGDPKKIVYATINDSIYVLNKTGSRIHIVDCATNTYVSDLTVGIGNPSGGVFNSTNNQLYYYDDDITTIKILNIPANTLSGTTILLAGKIKEMAYSSFSNHIWCYAQNLNIKVIDANLNTVVNTFAIPLVTTGKIVYSYSLNTVYSTFNNPTISVIQELVSSQSSFYISGSTNYNQFVRDNMVNPKKLDRIMIYAQTESNLNYPVLVDTEDATGNTCSDAYLPNTTISASQYQGKIGQLDFKDVVLDVSTTLSTTIPAFTTIKWVLFYKQYDKSDFLSGSVAIKSLCSKKGTQTYDEKYLIDTALISSWVTIMETKNFIKN